MIYPIRCSESGTCDKLYLIVDYRRNVIKIRSAFPLVRIEVDTRVRYDSSIKTDQSWSKQPFLSEQIRTTINANAVKLTAVVA